MKTGFVAHAPDQPKKLKVGAIPTIFNDYPKHLQPNIKRKRKNVTVEKRDTFQPSPRKKARLVSCDYTYASTLSFKERNQTLLKKLRNVNQKIRRQKKKISNLCGLIKHLRKENQITKDASSVLEHEFSGISLELIKNIHSNQSNKAKAQRYSETTKQFVVSLYYHSQKAYNYVCKMLCLPHPSSIRSWCSSVDCKPGFLSNVIDELKLKLEKCEIGREVSLVVDGMSIRKQTLWDRKEQKYTGFVDYGNHSAVECSIKSFTIQT